MTKRVVVTGFAWRQLDGPFDVPLGFSQPSEYQHLDGTVIQRLDKVWLDRQRLIVTRQGLIEALKLP